MGRFKTPLFIGGFMKVKGDIEFQQVVDFWFGEVKPAIYEALDVSPDDKLDWAPAEKMITLSNIFMHLREASNWWVETVMLGGKYKDLTPCKSPGKTYIKTLLDDHFRCLEKMFEKAPKILEAKFDMRKFKRESIVTGTWIMLHLFEHDIHHRSQINHYLRILGAKPPRI
jgi:uncharacterized damage-inducible protein DinB